MNSNNLSAVLCQRNRSLSSINSDAATFHSALTKRSPLDVPSASATPRPASPPRASLSDRPFSCDLPREEKIQAIRMDRHDSGYAEVISPRRTSSSTNRPSYTSRKRHTPSSSASSQPSCKRAMRPSVSPAQIRTSTSRHRPPLHMRHTTHSPTAPYQFYEFPRLADPEPPQQDFDQVTAPPPPASCQYWTSTSTRRLEYAAIDAASKGVRGFFIKLVPDCILPSKARRTKFHCDDADSDAGSVRRYRLVLPDEDFVVEEKPGVLKRLTSLGRRRGD